MSGTNINYNEQEIQGAIGAGADMFSNLFQRFGRPAMVVPEADGKCLSYYQELLALKAKVEELIQSGVPGPQGPQGEPGPKGEQGPQGEPGPQGETGATGPQGETGATGPAGVDGADGTTPVINFTASVDNSTGIPSVSTSESGTPTNKTVNVAFSHIKGETGAQGPAGTDGVSPTARVTQSGTNEITITVTDANGTTSATLTGEAGPQGPQGLKGDPGIQGPAGPTGPQGPAGADGAPGATGATGPAGPEGPAGADGTDGVTPVITITASQNGTPVPVTKTGTDAAPNFDIALTGGGSSGSLVGWGTEVASTANYPVIKNIKKSTSEAYSESGINLSGQLNDDQWQNIFFSGTCDVSVAADTVVSVNSSVKFGEKDNAGMLNWNEAGGFVLDNIAITDNTGVWTLSDVQAEVQYISDTGTFITGLSIKLTCTASDGNTTKTVTGNSSVSFDSFISYTTATTYQNLVVGQ